MTKTFSITGLSADNIAFLIAATGADEKLRKNIVKQFTDQATETDAKPKAAPKAAPKAEAPAKPKAKPAKKKDGAPSKRAVQGRITRAKQALGKAVVAGDQATIDKKNAEIAENEKLLASL